MAEEPHSFGGGGHHPIDKTASRAGAKPWQERRNATGHAGHPYGTGSGHAYGTGSDDDDNNDGTFTNVNKYFAEHGYGDEFCGPPSQEPKQDDRDLAGTAEKPNCNRRRLAFSSQETPKVY